jgi:hypothetical protein
MNKLAIIAVAGIAAVATAEPLTAGNGSGGSTGGAINLLDYATVTQTRGTGNTIVTITFNTDIPSFDLEGAPGNFIADLGLGGPGTIHGVGWDTTQSAFSPSWLSEQTVSFANAGDAPGLYLTPSGDAVSGTASYSSGGIVDLGDNGIPDVVIGSGTLRLEFFETFEDFPGADDGAWLEGSTITLDMTLVPAPGALALLGLGGLASIRRRR